MELLGFAVICSIILNMESTANLNPASVRSLKSTTEKLEFNSILIPQIKRIEEKLARTARPLNEPPNEWKPDKFDELTAGQSYSLIYNRSIPGGHIRDNFQATIKSKMQGAFHLPASALETVSSIAIIASISWLQRVCSAVFISPLHILTSAQCCVRVSTEHDNYYAVRTSKPFLAKDFTGVFTALNWINLWKESKDRPRAEILQTFYYDDFLSHKGKDICLGKTAPIERQIAKVDYEPDRVILIPPKWPKMDPSKDITELYKDPNQVCFAFTHTGPGVELVGIPALQVTFITSVDCAKKPRLKKLDADQFCMICVVDCNNEALGLMIPGGPVICDSVLIGIVISMDRFLKKNDPRTLIGTRIDAHEHFIYRHMNLYPATPAPNGEEDEKTEEDEGDTEEAIFQEEKIFDVWLMLLRLVQILALALLVLLVIGLLIHYGIWIMRIFLRKISVMLHHDPERSKWTRLAEKNLPIHYRIVAPLYVMIWVILMNIFQKYHKHPKLKPKQRMSPNV